jgi:hypothetical protein
VQESRLRKILPTVPSSLLDTRPTGLHEKSKERMQNRIAATLAIFIGVTCQCWAGVSVERLRCEYLQAPLGIDAVKPRLSWILQSAERGQKQKAYQVLVAATSDVLAADQGDLWDSGKVESDETVQVEYGGKPLASWMRCHWKVRAWDKDGRIMPWSEPALWTMGLLDAKDSSARWIAATAMRPDVVGGNGYQAAESPKADAVKWVQVDLGRRVMIDAVRLTPAHPEGSSIAGYGFPVRFRIEASDDPTFAKPTLLVDHTGADFPNPQDHVQSFPGGGRSARYVRVTATVLWRRPDGPYCFALAALEVQSGGKDVAKHAAVSAADSGWYSPYWSTAQLTNGHTRRGDPLAEKGPGDAAVLLRKRFPLKSKVVRATASICGLGYYELSINGQAIGDHKLDPGFTDFSKRVLYVTYDVTHAVRQGDNVIGVMLGNGWYRLPSPEFFGFESASWVASPRCLVHLRLDLADGSSQTLVSDATWKWSTGEITFQHIRGGETHDMRLAKPGWQTAGYDDREWNSAVVVAAPKGKLVAQTHPPIKADGEIKAVALTQPKPGLYVFKLAENTAGWIRFTASGESGRKITLKCNESLNPDGTLSDDLSGYACHRYQTDEFILSGKGREVFAPRFCYHGFQYVQVEGLAAAPALNDLVGIRVHTLPDGAGEFSCSNDRLNLLQTVFRRTYLNNLHGIPTDCPTREKMGWMCDGCVDEEFGIYNYQTAQFYNKWFRDIVDSQESNGHVPSLAPICDWGKSRPDGSPGEIADPWWGGAIVITPWRLYQYYADRRVLGDGYDAMKAYVDYLTWTAKDHLIDWPTAMGDWLDDSAGGGRRRMPVPQTSTAGYFYAAHILSQSAAILGKDTDAAKYASLAEAIRRTYNAKFLNQQTGLYAADSQTAQSLPLALGIVPEEKRDLVLQRLVESITTLRKGHISAGIVGTVYLFHALMQSGRDDLAYTMLTQETYPGWLPMLGHGGTTIWEAWNGPASGGSTSLNHPTFGCAGMWFYQGLAGIRTDPAAPGFKRIIIKPAVVGDLRWAKARYDSIHGPIVSEWERKGDVFTLNVTIPAGTTALVFVPTRDLSSVSEGGRPAQAAEGVTFRRKEAGAAMFQVDSGIYHFVSTL